MKSFAKIASLALVIGLALTLIWNTSTTKAQEQDRPAPVSENKSDLWSVVAEDQIASRGTRSLVPERYRTFSVDSARLRDSLLRSPDEFSDAARNSRNVIELPKPDGSFTRFRVEDSPLLSPEIAKQHPTWKTYQAYGIDEPGVTARLDMTDTGFHGYVFALEGTYSIDPFQANDIENYIVFYKSEFGAPSSGFHCRIDELLKDEPHLFNTTESAILAPEFTHGSQIRTYRMAIATTTQYTAFFRQVGDTDAQAQTRALNQVVTSLNRIDGVYRKELSVRFTLVSGTNLTYVTEPETPANYANSGGPGDLTVNQTNLDAIIGSANYDFGHVFQTANGGVAALSSVCNAGSKAQGLSGLPNPTGDPFDVDYVAHEMGHQMGGNHTFNAAANCGSSPTAARREPGSAVTIMGYAGICSSTANVARNSIDTFHVYNLTEAINFLNGAGGTCGTLATPNNPPVIAALTNYTIPFNTPFMLTASATDEDNDPLTYSWEQHDPGVSGSSYPGTTDDDDISLVFRPGFRSYLPVASGSRSFPSLTYILNNQNEAPITFTGTSAMGAICSGTCITGEDLPSAARTMNFRVTVRDGRGGISDAGTVLNVINTTTRFRVTTQNTASTWTGNTNQTVTWDVSGTTGGAINTANVKISLSTDGGLTFPTTILASTPNDGSESILVPNLPTTTARIKVEAVGNIFFDINDVNFTIIAGGGTPTPTNTPTATPTNTPTATPTNTPTATPTNTPTATPTVAPTATPTNTPTATPTIAPTATPTATPTNTPTATPTPVTTRVVRVVSVIGSPGGTVVVPITLDSLGNEGAMGLSVNFNTAILSSPTVVLGSGVPSGSGITLNPNELAQGRLGILMDSGDVFAASPPAREVFRITFNVAANAPNGPTPVTFGDSPIPRSMSDGLGNTIPSAYADGTVTIGPAGPAGFEGDVAPRPSGNGSVTSTDVIQLRRFAALLDTPDQGNERQRADCAPFATNGDGNINSGDVIQGRRFAAFLDPLTPAGGPARPGLGSEAVSSFFDDIYTYFFGREVRIGSAKFDESQVTVPVEITSNGDEMAAGFTLEYDATRFSNPRVVLGDAFGEGAILTVNANEAGRIGILVDSSEAMAASSAAKSIVFVTFDLISESDGAASFSLTDSLAQRSVVGSTGIVLPTRYVDGSVLMSK